MSERDEEVVVMTADTEPRRDSWPIGTRVVVRSPGSWADGLTGSVHHHTAEWPDRCTVQLDTRGRYCAPMAADRVVPVSGTERGSTNHDTRPSEPPPAPWPLVCSLCYQPWTDDHDCVFTRSWWRRAKEHFRAR